VKIILSKIAGFVRAVLIPNFMLGREKAIAAFVAPLLVGAVASLLGKHVAPGIVEQLLISVITSITVHQTTNRQAV
jgi:hypothetical protein